MAHIDTPLTLTLVAPRLDTSGPETATNASAGARTTRLLDEALDAIRHAGAELVHSRELSATAIEATIHGDEDPVRAQVRTVFADRAVDWAVQAQPSQSQRPPTRLLVCDMDSTIISCECVDEIADIVGIKAEIAAITEQAMRGELDFETSVRNRVARLAGVSKTELEAVYRQRVKLNPGARTLVATLNAAGARTALVSGGFTFFTEKVAAEAGFELHRANTLEMKDDRLTGALTPPILGPQAKQAFLQAFTSEIGAEPAQTLAIGDGANDLPMLGVAGLGVAYRAKPVVEAQAGARIASGDLRSALYFLGIEQDAFVEPG